MSCSRAILTSWRNTNPEIPATNSARKTSDRNMAYYENKEQAGRLHEPPLPQVNIICLWLHTHTHTHQHTHLTTINWTKCPTMSADGLVSVQDRGQPVFFVLCVLRLINQQLEHFSLSLQPISPTSLPVQPLTSFSIHGLPLQVAKHPNRPKTMMTVPVPMRTYGALVELSAIREMYGPSISFPHTPTASRMAPVI